MRSLDALDLELQAVVSCLEALALSEFKSSERTASILALNLSAPSSSSLSLFLPLFHSLSLSLSLSISLSPFWRQCGSLGICPAHWDSSDVPGPPVWPCGPCGGWAAMQLDFPLRQGVI